MIINSRRHIVIYHQTKNDIFIFITSFRMILYSFFSGTNLITISLQLLQCDNFGDKLSDIRQLMNYILSMIWRYEDTSIFRLCWVLWIWQALQMPSKEVWPYVTYMCHHCHARNCKILIECVQFFAESALFSLQCFTHFFTIQCQAKYFKVEKGKAT